MSPAAPNLNIFSNPICIKCARARLRWKHTLSWGTIVLTITAFVCLIVYLTATERELLTAEESAKSLLVPLIVIQGVLLMLFGTGSVASGLAREREGRLLDYHRMTPMSPTAKILGFLFGLPAREYFLFALTLPFLAFAVIRSGFPPGKLLNFYLVFFTSVWLYHMTGMVAGMVSSRPRFAAMLAQGLVVLLYFVLPQLSWLGFSFFEFLTIRPTMFGMIASELSAAERMQAGLYTDLDQYQHVPFFKWTLNATVYTLLVQSFLLLFMYIVVYRKWRNEPSHPLSKLSGLAFFVGTQMFLVGNIWPIVSDARAFEQLLMRTPLGQADVAPAFVLFIIMFVFMMISGFVMLLMVGIITPSRHTVRKGYELARKLGYSTLRPNSDAASSLPATMLMILLAAGSCVALVTLAVSTDRFFEALPHWRICAAPLLFAAAVVLFVQGLCERFSARVYLVSMFLMWMLPLFSMLILFSAEEAWVAGSYVGLPFPLFALWVELFWFLHSAVPIQEIEAEAMPREIVPHLPALTWIATSSYVVLAAAMQLELRRWKKTLRLTDRQPVAAASPDPAGPVDAVAEAVAG